MTSKLVSLVFNMWDDADRAFAELSAEEATTQHDGGSSFGWTLVHQAAFEDGFINVAVRGLPRHPVLQQQFEQHRASGASDQWPAILDAAREVRASLREYLAPLSDAELETIAAPATSRRPAYALRYILMRDVAHTYFHIGEVASKRDRLGKGTGDYPGPLPDAI